MFGQSQGTNNGESVTLSDLEGHVCCLQPFSHTLR